MKSPEEWSRCFNWNGQTEGQILYQIEAIQRDALREAAEIARHPFNYCGGSSHSTQEAWNKSADAILERAETLTPHFHSTIRGKE